MILGAFGDSFLFGSDLSDIQDHDSVNWFFPSKLTYPASIANKLNMEYLCTALPAQGNKVIADDILRAVLQHKDKMVYIINWTWIDRFEYIGQGRTGNSHGWCSTLPNSKNYHSEYYYKHFYSDIDAKISNLMYIDCILQSLLQNNCKFIMTFMDELLFDKQFHCPPSVEYLQNKIQPYVSTFDGMNFLDWSRNHGFPISDNWHPLEQAHEAATQYWLPTVKHMLNTSAKEDIIHASK